MRDFAYRLSFVSVAVWWVLFSIPLFRKVPEPAPRLEADETVGENSVVIASRRLVETFRELRRYKDAGLVLLAFLVYNDGVNTIVHMAMTFGGDIGIDASAMIGALVMVQFVGVPFAFAFGLLADRIGTKNAIYITLAVYSAISVYGFFLQTVGPVLRPGVLRGDGAGRGPGPGTIALRHPDPPAQGRRDVRLLRGLRPLRRRPGLDHLRACR